MSNIIDGNSRKLANKSRYKEDPKPIWILPYYALLSGGKKRAAKWDKFIEYMKSIGNVPEEFTQSQLDDRFEEWKDKEKGRMVGTGPNSQNITVPHHTVEQNADKTNQKTS